jgi:hypothetical protein
MTCTLTTSLVSDFKLSLDERLSRLETNVNDHDLIVVR